jgi:hypothetical protein
VQKRLERSTSTLARWLGKTQFDPVGEFVID